MEIHYIGFYMVIASGCIYLIACAYEWIKYTIDVYKRGYVRKLAWQMLYWWCAIGCLLMIVGIFTE